IAVRTAMLLAALVLLSAPPVLAQVKGAPGIVAVAPPPLSAVPSSNSGCTPVNPCAVATPALDRVALPAPAPVPQPDRPAAAPAGVAGSGSAAQAASPVRCPPRAGARGGRGAGRGAPPPECLQPGAGGDRGYPAAEARR